jgi:DNA-binding NarL/FixJ family response regulator
LSQIVKLLGLSVNTVKVHTRFAYRRLGVNSRMSAVNRLQPSTCPHCGGALSNHQRYVE